MMKIKALLFVVGILTANVMSAQTLKVQGASPSLYLTHTVAAKETWYSIGRLYNVSPKEIAPLNNTTMDKPLAIGQSVKIPLTTNFSVDGTKAADEVFVPLYHTVQEKEWLYRISQSHNKVPVANLEKWNNVSNDGVKPGMNLIVGYLKVKQGQSTLAASGTSKIVAVTATAPAKTETVTQTAKEPVTAANEDTRTSTEPKTTEPKATDPKVTETVKETTKPVTTTAPVATTTPATTPVATTTPATTAPATTTPATNTTPATSNVTVNYKGGYFKSLFENGKGGTSGNAGVFKSTSGWKDGKYYALMNNVPVGTIVKVSFTSTQKAIYAKVLGQLPEMKESIGLTIRLSDAAASELGAENSKFYVDVKY